MTNTLSELKRRNIFRVAGVYAVAGWLLAQLASALESSLNMPGWFDTVVVSLLLLGFPVAMILAWAFEMTPEGFKKTQSLNGGDENTQTTGRKLDYVLIGGLALVGLLIIGDRAIPKATVTPSAPIIAAIDTFTGQSIAVLPFEDFSPDQDQEYFADGIAEELLNVLARVEGLRVTSRTSAFSYKGREASIAEIGKALNVAHILEGSVRKAGDTLRITAQLIDTKTDEHMWSTADGGEYLRNSGRNFQSHRSGAKRSSRSVARDVDPRDPIDRGA
ncbi:MAG: TolB-like protein [Polaribacter sp.]|jgi:TolB-like protein